MNTIKLTSKNQIMMEADELRSSFNRKVKKIDEETIWDNTEASLAWIVRGGIGYFFNLNSNFLGEGNGSGIPAIEADYFANNIYRVINAVDYLAELRNFELEKSKELNLLLDIRTLIVHSGERLSGLKSLGLTGYKDSQLGRIFKRQDWSLHKFDDEFSSMDYCITVWNDKHDKSQKYNLAELDYNRKNENYKDVDIYLKAKDVKNVVLGYIEDFVNYEIRPKKKVRRKINIPEEKIFSKKMINFKLIARVISKDLRGGYFKENNVGHWDGFGLQKLYEYVKGRSYIHEETKAFIMWSIESVMSIYWKAYQDGKTDTDNLPVLNIMEVFKEYTPWYNLENYNYRDEEKLFEYVTTIFNTEELDSTDVDCLREFISEINNGLKYPVDLKQNADDLICDYFVKSIQESIFLNKEVINEKNL